jgi:glycosyltransferase involved in cell wall biosynthesis/tetratricopeptide (TPR) repeat protein
MPPADVSLCLITKDEPLLKGGLESIRPFVKEIVVVVTGGELTPEERFLIDKTDYFEAQNPEYGCFDFSRARNRSFELATCKYLMWMDADDVIVGGPNLKAELEFLESVEQDAQLMMPYEYCYDRPYGEGGNVTCLLSRERIMRNHVGYHWDEPVHEAIVPIPPEAHRYARTGLLWQHRKGWGDVSKAWHRNIEILKKVNAKRPTPRNVFYLATAYYDGGMLEEAKPLYVKFTTMTQFEEELHRVYLNLNDIALRQGQINDAITWAHKAIECKEKWFESYFALMRSYYARADLTKNHRDWERAVHFGELAKSYPPAKSFQPTQPMARALEYYRWMSRAYDMIGRGEDAYNAALEGLKAGPEDGFLKFNALFLGAALARAKFMSALRTLKESAGKERAVDRLIRDAYVEGTQFVSGTPFLPPEEVPQGRSQGTTTITLHAAAMPVLTEVPKSLDIVFACYGVDPWNPAILRGKGVGGGSEVAVVEMATRLAAKGHHVAVFCPGPGGRFEGVSYEPQEMLAHVTATQDVLFAWRSTAQLSKVNAHLKILWLHDVYAWNDTWTGPASFEEYDRADVIFCVSQWQADNLQNVPRQKIIVTRNGVARPERFVFTESTKRQPGKVIYNSSPDRGLERLLEMWPRLRAAAPHAELHIFYGFDGWMKFGHNRTKGEEILARIRALEATGQGVMYHGRVTQDELAQEMVTADCWFYPNWDFPEVSCVAAMEAQIAGLWIVSSKTAALLETAAGWSVFADDAEQFEEAAIAHLDPRGRDPGDGWADIMVVRLKYAREARARFSLDTLADEWNALLRVKLQEKIKPFELPLYEGVLP